jgi:hypothetical protein
LKGNQETYTEMINLKHTVITFQKEMFLKMENLTREIHELKYKVEL